MCEAADGVETAGPPGGRTGAAVAAARARGGCVGGGGDAELRRTAAALGHSGVGLELG